MSLSSRAGAGPSPRPTNRQFANACCSRSRCHRCSRSSPSARIGALANRLAGRETPPPRRARLVAGVTLTAIRRRRRARWSLVSRGRSADGEGVILRRARLGLAAAGLGLLLGGAGSVSAGAQETLDELQEERDRVQQDQRETDEVLDVLTLDLDVAEAELRRLDRLATDARSGAVQARADADAAAAEAARSSSSADLADSELGELDGGPRSSPSSSTPATPRLAASTASCAAISSPTPPSTS